MQTLDDDCWKEQERFLPVLGEIPEGSDMVSHLATAKYYSRFLCGAKI